MANQRYIEVPLDLFATDSVLQCPPTVHLSLFPPPRLSRAGRHRTGGRPPSTSSHLPASMWSACRRAAVVSHRAMDVDVRSGLELPDDVIEAVAKANTAARVEAGLLPEVRQCPFHNKRGALPPQQLQTTTHHGGLAPLSPRKISLLTQQRLVQEMKARLEMEDRRKREETMRNVPVYRKPTLPESIASRELVMTWLSHGTDPSADTHFPDIERGKRSTARSRKTHANTKKSFVSE